MPAPGSSIPDFVRIVDGRSHPGPRSKRLAILPANIIKGFSLSCQCFVDALDLSDGWSPSDLPDNCACSSPFSIAPAMTCLTGYTVRHHNHVCDYLVTQIQAVCPVVDTETKLSALPEHPD